MRAGGCTVQQHLTVEAANVVKQAITLARRRGHAQVTPLHVANTMLSASNGLLRTACLQSHSHPLQCKALELCFNVALNRLPASSSSPMLGHHSQQYPTISNALVAAFKRAQAHQRRGSIENQQQPLLAVKVELEQLIISILDDPSVSRVMREAGFSSSQVKNNVEQAVSLELCSQVPSTRNKSIKENSLLVLSQPSTAAAESAEKASKPRVAADPAVKDEDVISVIKCLMNGRKRSIVVVGECLANIDGVVRGLMDKVDKGNVPEALKEVKFISIPPISFGHRHREEVEQKIGELTCLVRRLMDKGVILYLGDLKWISDFRASSGDQQGRSYNYCPVEHMITDFGRLLLSGVGENGKCWLMGIATFQTYMRCRSGHQRSLETLWGLHPITLPAGSLSLSLSTESGESRSKTAGNGSYNQLLIDSHRGNEEMIQLNCCADCSAKFETEARSMRTAALSNSESTLSSLPSWLKEESIRLKDNDQNCMPVRELCKKWNKVCSSFHKQTKSSVVEGTTTFSSSTSPSSSTSFFSYDQQLHGNQFDPKQHSCSDDDVPQQHFWAPTTQCEKKYSDEATTTSFRLYISEHSSRREPKQVVSNSPLLSTTTSTPNSASSSDNNNNNNNIMETEYLPRFKEFNCENLNILCNALEKKIPWQKDVIPDIAGTILQCRSGMLRRKFEEKLRIFGGSSSSSDVKEETWLFFQGLDVQAKENMARELAKIIFGSYSKFISVALSSFCSYSTEDMKNKRSRDELDSSSYIGRLAQAISDDPHRVFFVEDVEQADLCSRVGIKRAIQRGRINSSSGEEVSLSDAIIILSCESFSSRSRACSPPGKQKSNSLEGRGGEEVSPCVSLDLNLSFDDYHDDDGGGGDDDTGEEEKKKKRVLLTPGGIRKVTTGSGGSTQPSCQVDDCEANLKEAKPYHRRHKVCELHAKASAVTIAGIQKRFCQQCSRFHDLSEFDEAKRSCRRRLAGHNERRRKSSSDSHGDG